jgi:hypothetical protein
MFDQTNATPHSAWVLSHHPRPIRPVERFTIDGWALKVYSVAGLGPVVSPLLIDCARQIAAQRLPQPAITALRYGVGFVVIHEAAAFNTVLVDWWECTNELRHHVFRAAAGSADFTEITESGESVCVWELRVQAFEREAWLRHVLNAPGGSNLRNYLGALLSENC